MKGMAKTSYFSSELFHFLEDLKKHNNRTWFQANRSRYERDVRDPLLRFVVDFKPRLGEITTHFLADPRPVGGSLIRIYRDTRFSADKSPYKTMAGALFRHEHGKSVVAPAFFLHLEAGESFAGIGLHHPDPMTLAKVRQRIAASPSEWKSAISGRVFASTCVFAGDSLKHPPKGYDLSHPCIEDLKRKDYCTMIQFSNAEVRAPDFLDRFTKTCRTAAPLMKFLTNAIGLTW